MARKKKQSGFMMQAAILATAGFISRVIGVLYAAPLYHIIGEEGNGYYGTAFTIYSMILLISTYSIPTAVSKVISQRLALEEYKNAKRLFTCSLIYVLVVGSIAATLTFIFAPILVIEPSVLSLRVMAPTIFLSGLLSVFRGYMQAYNTMVPTAISQVIEQIANALVSVGAAYLITLPLQTEGGQRLASHGAAGSALGTGAGVVAGLIFILITFAKKRASINEKVALDPNKHEESYLDLFKVIFLMVTPVVLATFIYNVSSTVDMKIFWKIMDQKNVSTSAASAIYGIYTRQFVVLMNLPIAIAAATSSALIPNISYAYSKNDIGGVKEKLSIAIRATMLIVIPATVGMAVLANPIMQLLFSGTTKAAGYALSAGSIAIVFYALSTITNGALQAIGRVTAPVKNAAITLVIHTVFVFLVMYFTDAYLVALVAGTVMYAFLMCVFNSLSIRKYIGYRMNMKRFFLAPLFASAIMGALTFLVYHGMLMLVHSNVLSLIPSILVAVIIYFVLIIKVSGYSEEDLLRLPCGKFIVNVSKKVKLIK